ncbi:DUF6501 family protein [Bacillus badius]|uniref:Uncharacterized protein n=1 Tax=Bacillus badius TaxID=1455 RepID=A0ABR5AWN0_BACBA|nr:DUF6501 family protein [Bacillus badius]KIL74280.1 hypothetical protein SD78_1349 [Bacillus badius]KIL79159.1 hypothetical protein SD77_3579 [Bacillus badius]KZN99602.1 hypothetical protein A4244_16485 [Bacillus badius]KZR57974.1 hypothetical protein A3781_18850 [Bacillus badius]MED0665878.1 DUF6501 family protein [Bacillus badius]
MNHLQWTEKETIKKVKCLHTNAKKYMVENRLTPGKLYDVKNETEEFYFLVDDKGKVSGFYKDYFEMEK